VFQLVLAEDSECGSCRIAQPAIAGPAVTAVADSFTWLPEVSKTFSVRSCYKMLSGLRIVEAAPNLFLVALNLLRLHRCHKKYVDFLYLLNQEC
jgi:hypothetical protein